MRPMSGNAGEACGCEQKTGKASATRTDDGSVSIPNPLNDQICLSLPRKATITANPNPIKVWDGSGLGETELSYTVPEGAYVDIRIGSPDGTLFVGAGASGTARTGKWVTDGMVFYLQDVSERKPLTRENTLATVTVRVVSELALGDQLTEKQTRLNQVSPSLGWRR